MSQNNSNDQPDNEIQTSKWSKVAEQSQELESSASEREEVAQPETVHAESQPALDQAKREDLEQQLNEAENKINEYWNKILRLQAEVDNLHRRAERDVANAHKFGLEKFILELIPIVDSIEKGLEIAVGDNELAKRLHEGMELTLSMFLKAFEKFGVQVIDPQGESFNPAFHQAISMLEQADAAANTVIKVLQKGFVLNGRLVRPALVIVAK